MREYFAEKLSKARKPMDDESYRNHAVTSAGVYPDESFSGEHVEYWDDGTLKFRGVFGAGRKRHGVHVCFWENGRLREVSFWVDGWNSGTLLSFREDGTKRLERDYGEDGAKSQSWTEKRYGSDSRLIAVEKWEDGKMVSKWLDDQITAAIQQAQASLEEEEAGGIA